MFPESVPDVAEVEVLRGPQAGEGARADLLVEVPHGADRHTHYVRLRARLRGRLPVDLEEFFYVNTDVGAYQVGRRVAERVVAADPTGARVAVVVRSLIPRTFIDCNRPAEAPQGDLAAGGLTAGVPAYVTDDADRALLLGLHRRYVEVVEAALGALSERGFLFLPHTYGPVTLGIETVDETIVERLRWAHAPERYATWPARPEVDLISRAPDGTSPVDPRVLEQTAAGYRALGLEVAENKTYPLHPSSLAHRFSFRVPGRALCLELRRDKLVPGFRWNRENTPDPTEVDRLAGPPAEAIAAFLAPA